MKSQNYHQQESTFVDVATLEVTVFKYTLPRLRGQPSLEDMIDAGLLMPNDSDQGNVLVDTDEKEPATADVTHQQSAKSRAEQPNDAYYDTRNDMDKYPTPLLRWDEIIVTDRGNARTDSLFLDQKQEEEAHGDNLQPHQHQVHDQIEDEVTALGNGLIQHSQLDTAKNSAVSLSATVSSTRQRMEQQQLNPTETIIVLPGGSMLRGGDSMISQEELSFPGHGHNESSVIDSMSLLEPPELRLPTATTSNGFPFMAPLIVVAFVAMWSSKARTWY